MVVERGLRRRFTRARPPRRAVLPTVRDRTERPRARPRLRNGGRPIGLRSLPYRRRTPAGALPVRGPPGVDDDAVDAGVEYGGGRPTRRHVRGRENCGQ